MEPRFKAGDVVVFAGEPLFNGQPHHAGYFDTDAEYTVIDHSPWKDQWDRHFNSGYINVLLKSTRGNSDRWVDQDCLALAGPTDDEIAALFGGAKPVATDREFLEGLSRHKRIPPDVRKEIREHLGL